MAKKAAPTRANEAWMITRTVLIVAIPTTIPPMRAPAEAPNMPDTILAFSANTTMAESRPDVAMTNPPMLCTATLFAFTTVTGLFLEDSRVSYVPTDPITDTWLSANDPKGSF